MLRPAATLEPQEAAEGWLNVPADAELMDCRWIRVRPQHGITLHRVLGRFVACIRRIIDQSRA